MSREPAPIRRLRSALPGLRAALVGFALLLASTQLALQTHLVTHDLLPADHPVCEQCVVAKAGAAPSSSASVALAAAPRIAPPVEVAPLATPSVPLFERSRGPPAAA